MNNFTFGDAERQYYETICGGAGAGPRFAGASAVQTHMTNSRLTDPEILECALPGAAARVLATGAARAAPAAGVAATALVRRIEFRAPLEVAILANHRRNAPCGLAGGRGAVPGAARIRRADGTLETLAATAPLTSRRVMS